MMIRIAAARVRKPRLANVALAIALAGLVGGVATGCTPDAPDSVLAATDETHAESQYRKEVAERTDALAQAEATLVDWIPATLPNPEGFIYWAHWADEPEHARGELPIHLTFTFAVQNAEVRYLVEVPCAKTTGHWLASAPQIVDEDDPTVPLLPNTCGGVLHPSCNG